MLTNSRVYCQAKSSGRTRFPPLIQPRAAEQAFLRWHAAPEAKRLALAVFHAGYSEETAVHELRVALAWWAQRGRYRLVRCGPLAVEMLDDALAELETKFEEVTHRIRNGVTECLRRGLTRDAIEARVARFVATCDPVPPQYLVDHAIDRAVDWFDWRQERWQQHDQVAA
jgi:hypothetical protein